MANELEILNNPTSTPEAVSTGYQRQNTRAVAASAGLDCSVLETSGLSAILKTGGPVDVNGVLYSVVDDATLTPPAPGRYFVRLAGTGDNLTPELTTDAGTYDPVKNARYDGDGYRILNWIVYSDGTAAYVSRLLTPENERNIAVWDEPEEWWISEPSGDRIWIAPRSKYYDILICGKGGRSGSASSSGATTAIGGDGGGGATGFKRIFIEAGEVWTATFNASHRSIETFTTFGNGVTTLQAQNGFNGESAANGVGARGASGQTAPGCDRVIPGQMNGKQAFLCPYRYGPIPSGDNYNGVAGDLYGGGAYGARRESAGTGTYAEGGAGLVRIRG